MKKNNWLSWSSGIITTITILAYVGILFVNGVYFSSEQQPIILFISGITIFSIFANMVSYWSLVEQSVLDSDEMRKAFDGYDDYVRDNIKDAYDFDKVINEEYNASKREQKKEQIYKKFLSNDLYLKHYNKVINRNMPKIRFIETSKYYKNKEKVLQDLKAKVEQFMFKKDRREQYLNMVATTKSIHYHRVSPHSIFTRNNTKSEFADGINKLNSHKNIFLITRTAFSTATTFFPIIFVFSITGQINNSYIVPIAMGLIAVIITILQTTIFAKRYTKNDTIEYLNDLFYICKWYVSFKTKDKK